MNKKIIEEVITDIIHKNYSNKCSRVSTRASVQRAFERIADKYGLQLKVSKPLSKVDEDNVDSTKNTLYTLYDKEHNTRLEFTEQFLDDNFIAFSDKGNHKNHSISIDEVIEGYTNLPETNKNSVNLILFKNNGDGSDTTTLASSNFISLLNKEMNVINIPSYYFNKYNPTGEGYDNYNFIMAHESMHCLDYTKVSDKTYQLIQRYFDDEGSMDFSDRKKVLDYATAGDTKIMTKSNGKYLEANGKNIDYLMDNGVNEDRAYSINRASDYGTTKFSEDYAEAGAMVIMGYKNPDNPQAVVRWNNEEMQYREWVKLHPYKAQYMVKQIYGEDVGVDALLSESVDTVRNLLPTDD